MRRIRRPFHQIEHVRDKLAELVTEESFGEAFVVDKAAHHVFYMTPLEGPIVQVTVSTKGTRMEYGTWGI